MLPGCGPVAGSARLLPQPLRSKAMTRNPAREKLVVWDCQIALVPVLAWRSTMGAPVPPVSVNHNFTLGSSAYVPEGAPCASDTVAPAIANVASAATLAAS